MTYFGYIIINEVNLTEGWKVAKVIVPVVTVAITAGIGGIFSSMVKKITPVFATVKR